MSHNTDQSVVQEAVYWLSPVPVSCQTPHCGVLFSQKGDGEGVRVMYDASIPTYRGQWGNICHACFVEHGCSLGTGKGQRYELQPDNKWLKTGG